jgi:CxxC motif-containing protein (DUF1111 family)
MAHLQGDNAIMRKMSYRVPLAIVIGATLMQTQIASSQTAPLFRASDPGVRGGAPGAGGSLAGLTANEVRFFAAGKLEFEQADDVIEGLGPAMNLDSCGGCHSQPATGGSSPTMNPQVAFAKMAGATNTVPSFIRPNGPIREARFVRKPNGSADGGVHALFTIEGRTDAPGCRLAQPDFATQLLLDNVIFRIPTPVFGAGLIEQIPDVAIRANKSAEAVLKASLGISGRVNTNGNDGTITRFGWKAQNKSLLLFSGEAYNVEMGVTNELFQQEREEKASCQFAGLPNTATNAEALTPLDALSAIEKFAIFQRFLAAPTPSPDAPGGAASIGRGRSQFSAVGCTACHTPALPTGNSTVAALNNKTANLYSDLLLHNMGPRLADGISQGEAGPAEFRTAPLWGLGQRVFFLHDGRTSDLLEAIAVHRSGLALLGNASEANEVVGRFNNLGEPLKQDLLNFLRSL